MDGLSAAEEEKVLAAARALAGWQPSAATKLRWAGRRAHSALHLVTPGGTRQYDA
jgi:hypothetical protein